VRSAPAFTLARLATLDVERDRAAERGSLGQKLLRRGFREMDGIRLKARGDSRSPLTLQSHL
jgi:hypothetical protein